MTALAPLDLFPPGVRRIGGRRRPPIRGVPADVAGFVGIAERGPAHRAVRVESRAQFDEIFGAAVPQGLLAPSVALFFENGGRVAWIVRALNAETADTARCFIVRDGAPSVKIEADSPGRWGNRIRIRVEPTSADRFTLRVAAPGRPEEIWPGLSLARLADDIARPSGFGRTVAAGLEDPPSFPATLGTRAGDRSSLRISRPPYLGRGETIVDLGDGSLSPKDARLTGGRDGLQDLTARDFGTGTTQPLGLKALEEVDEVALLALPDLVWSAPLPVPDVPRAPSSACQTYFSRGAASMPPMPLPDPDPPEPRRPFTPDERARLAQEMTAQARRQRDRFAILDCVHPAQPRRIFDDGDPDPAAQRMTDAEYGAVYFPWVETAIIGTEAVVPPSGAMAGIFARTTLREGPHVAPANERLNEITGLAYHVSDSEHALLNGARVNVLRAVPGRGLRPMGARTRRGDGPFRQIAIRRLVNFIVETLDEETQWLVFEPNDRATRADLARAVRGFLDRIWRQGMLDGARPEQAYSVRVDASANPPHSLAAGRLICELAVRPPWPAEWLRLRLLRAEGGFELVGFGPDAAARREV